MANGVLTKISKLKKGDKFKKVGSRVEYIYNGKQRVLGKGKKAAQSVFTFIKFSNWEVGYTIKDIDVVLISRIYKKSGYSLGEERFF